MNRQSSHWDQLASHPLDASVIDPKDRLGCKNRYIADLRNREILRALGPLRSRALVLDLGCGTGGVTTALVQRGWGVVGIDISPGLLARTSERQVSASALFVLYDGKAFPIGDSSVDAITTYVVLNHVLDDEDLAIVLAECRRVLKPGGRMVCIEQVRKRAFLDVSGWKKQRTHDEFISAFKRAGLRVGSSSIVRYGRFPTTILVRLGLIPARYFPALARAEQAYGHVRGVAWRDYCDVAFVLGKPHEGE